MVIDPVTGYFELAQYHYKIAISIANLVGTTGHDIVVWPGL